MPKSFNFGDQEIHGNQNIAGRDFHIHETAPKKSREKRATLRIYRGTHMMYPHMKIQLTLDDVKIGALGQESALELKIDPGQHVLKARSFFANTRLAFPAKAGEKIGVIASFIYLIVKDEITLDLVTYEEIQGRGRISR
jgi:hypothetical protein